MKITLTLIFLFSAAAYSQQITFIKEDITFRLDENYFKVDGLYWFVNKSDKNVEKLIYYPFATESELDEIDSIEVFNQSRNYKEAVKEITQNGLKYLLKTEEGDTVIYRVGYRQKVISDSVKYILTSTKEWGQALEKAEYKLIVKNKFKIKSFSYKPDQVYTIGDDKIFYWKKNNFLPEDDMIFYFDRK